MNDNTKKIIRQKLDMLYVSNPTTKELMNKREILIKNYEELLGLRKSSRSEALVENAEVKPDELS